MFKLVDMLTYCRPEGSSTQQVFNNKYLRPIFGEPDKLGNYILVIGRRPKICFAAHSDTVHTYEGMQTILREGGILSLPTTSKSSCLGADCTTGVWLILEMIRANVEGVYVVHAAEEIGCKGSRYINDRFPRWVEELDYCISFDRKGTSSIITHQMGHRTASDDFAHSLAEILGMDLQPDTTGSYTDSNEYAKSVSECTNLSVGYNAQHTNRETQDIAYLELLRDRLISADWSKLRASRDPDNVEFLYQATGKGHWSGLFEGIDHREVLEGKYPIRSWTEALEPDDDLLDMTDLVSEHPRKIAEWLLDQNITYSELVDFLDLQDAVIPNSHNW